MADSGKTGRSALVETYLKQAQERPPLYQSAPVTHIVPEFNTVTYALDARLLDTEVLPESLNKEPSSHGHEETLTLKGYSVAPYVALSLQRVGLGFNIEAGRKAMDYETTDLASKSSQQSSVDYRGVGVYGFFKLLESKRFVTTLIAGGKTVNARHVTGPTEIVGQQTDDDEVRRYTVLAYEAGLNVGVRLLKSFTIVPWCDYTRYDDSSARAQVADRDSYQKTAFEEELDVFWHAHPDFNYGLDFAVRLGSVEVRLGGLFGMIVGAESGSDQVKDKGYSLSVSWDQKG